MILDQAEVAFDTVEAVRCLVAEARTLLLASTGLMLGMLDRMERAAAVRVPAGTARSAVPRIRA